MEINKPKTGSLTTAKPLEKLPKGKRQKAPLDPCRDTEDRNQAMEAEISLLM